MSPEFTYSDLLPIGPDTTKYRSLGTEGVRTLKVGELEFLEIAPEAIEKPNFTSSCAVAIDSWVWASIPGVKRNRTCWTLFALVAAFATLSIS